MRQRNGNIRNESQTQLKSNRIKLPWTENEILDHTVQHLSIPIATGRAAVGLCAGHLGVIEREIRSRTGPSAYALSPMTASPAPLTVIIKVTLLVLGAVGGVPPCGQVINQHVVPVTGYYGLSTASEVFLIFTTQLYQHLSVFSICTF